MPLASNAASARPVLVPKPNENKKNKSTMITNKTDPIHRRRDSISSVNSCGSQNSSTMSSSNIIPTKNRLSLPKSLPSATIMTKSKVDRRRSLKAKENERQKEPQDGSPNPKRKYKTCDDHDTEIKEYSPPETRSATKKKKLNPNFFDPANRDNALLQFSPPNQTRNAQREQELIQQKEDARYV
jgi:hypothetical protein